MGTRTALYRHFNNGGELLYVGISLRAVERLLEHIGGSPWRHEIASFTIEWFESREAALDAERIAIKSENPIFNKTHSTRPKPAPNPEPLVPSAMMSVDAPDGVVVEIKSEAMALAVSMKAGGHKLAYVAACIGKSEAYVCQMRKGNRPIPERLVMPLCAATGSLLLRQFRDMQDAIEAVTEAREVERLAELLREAA